MFLNINNKVNITLCGMMGSGKSFIGKIIANKIKYNCLVLERYRDDSKRTVKYYLAKERDYMFLKIIDNSPERTNTLRLEQVLSFG